MTASTRDWYQKLPVKTRQVNVRLSEDILKRLIEAASRFNRRSYNGVAAEIIEQYLEFWELAEQAKHNVLHKQRSAVKRRKEEEAGDKARKSR